MKYSMAKPFFLEEDRNYILNEFEKILSGEGMLSMGKYVNIFEKKIY